MVLVHYDWVGNNHIRSLPRSHRKRIVFRVRPPPSAEPTSSLRRRFRGHILIPSKAVHADAEGRRVDWQERSRQAAMCDIIEVDADRKMP